jgi:hypothetical protein
MIDRSKYYSDKEFLKAADIKSGAKFFIDGTEDVQMSRRLQLVVRFRGVDKGLGLNKKNLNFLLDTFGPDETKWIGKSVALYHVPSTTPEGKPTTSIEIRKA